LYHGPIGSRGGDGSIWINRVWIIVVLLALMEVIVVIDSERKRE
jgi:hypothetical protein